MTKSRKIATCDCETDPFIHGRVGAPFVWGYFDGTEFITFDTTADFVAFVKEKPLILYAHNGGKFDFMYLLSFVSETRAQIINGRIISMYIGECELVDSLAAVPLSMRSIQKDDIEYWKLEAIHRANHMPEILTYLQSDCIYLYNLMAAYRKAAGTKKTIASNALAFCKKQGTDPGTSHYRFDQNYRPFYFGGRTECFKAGAFENISVYDIRSSYPRAMQEQHPTGMEFHRDATAIDRLSREELQRSFIILECDADGCFPYRTGTAEGLSFPTARNVYYVTGWEYIAAKDLGLIAHEKIISIRYTEETISFEDYVRHWFEYKNRYNKKTDPINYTIGKIMMNSLYGKLAQNPERYHDYKIVDNDAPLPCNAPRIDKHGDQCKVCGFDEYDHGWKFYTKFEGKTFHRRESLWKHQYRHGITWEAKPLYKNVATGASITGYARASLLRAIHAVGREHVIYCDTDSLVVDDQAAVWKLSQTDAIGDWEREINRARIGYFAGKKLYAIEIDPTAKCSCNDRNGMCSRHKVVTKGARLTYNEVIKVVDGESILYKPAAPSFSLANGIGFVDRTIRRTMR